MFDYVKKQGKYNINEIPGTIDNRVFVGGNYDLMLILREICEIIWASDLQPIFAYDFGVPEDKINEYDIRLIQNCNYVAFESTIDAGQLLEFPYAKQNNAAVLTIYNVRDEEHQEKPSGATTMLSTDQYPNKVDRYYVTSDNLRGIIREWLARKVVKKTVASPVGTQEGVMIATEPAK